MHKPLVKRDRIFLPPLHIKLGLFKQFVKALDNESSTFAYLAEKFPSLSQAKIKEGIFIGPEIRKIVLDETFITHLKSKEKLAFESFKKVSDNFLGNHRSEDYVQVVNDLLSHYHYMGCNMPLKVHVLHSHLDFFGENLGDVSDEHGEIPSGYFSDGATIQRKMEPWHVGRLLLGYKKEDHTPHKTLRRAKVV